MRVRVFRGFTVVEVLLVVTLIAVASVVVSYEVFGRLDKTALWSGSQKMLRVARFAGLLAGEHHVACEIHIDLDAGSYWLSVGLQRDRLGWWSEDEMGTEELSGRLAVGNPYEEVMVLPKGLRFERVLLDGQPMRERGVVVIAFAADGSRDAAVVQIGNERGTHSLLIYPWTARCQLVGRAVDALPVDTVRVDPSRGWEGWL